MRRRGPRNYAGLSAVLISLLLLSVGTFVYLEQKAGMERSIGESALQDVSFQAELLSQWAQLRMTELKMIANTDTIRSGREEQKLDYLRREAERLNGNYYRIGFTDLAGRMTLSDGNRVDAAAQPGFREALQGQNYISGPVRDAVDGETALLLMRTPYFDAAGDVAGVVGASFRLELLFNRFFTVEPGLGAVYYLIAGTGEVFTIDDGRVRLLTAPPSGLSALAGGAGGMFRLHGQEREMAVVHAGVTGMPWHVAVAMPVRELFAPIAKFRQQMIVILTLLEIVVLLPLMLFYRKIARRLLMLSARLARLNYAARHDELTSLPNRKHLIETLKKLIRRSPDRAAPLIGLAVIDLDRFKDINDTLGQLAGDQFLIQVAHTLTKALGPGERLFRIGGDEFGLLMSDLQDKGEGSQETQRLLRLLQQPLRVGEHEFLITGSAGVSYYPEQAMTGSDLLKNADMAMYQAKRSGGGVCALYEDTMAEERSSYLQLEGMLRKAVANDELSLVYQPIVSLASAGGISAECLVRWNAKGVGPVGPNIFIPMAEETGAILDIGRWVLNEACLQLAEWRRRGVRIGRLSVNISPVQLMHSQFLAQVRDILNETGCDPRELMLEVTETAVITRLDVVSRTLSELARLGITIALDDFGTGYSSLSTLHRLDFHVLKIDRSFIAYLREGSKDEAVVKVILSVARDLGLMVVAEGVETEMQRTLLHNLECSHAQGYYFSKPMSAAHLEQFVSAYAAGGTG